MQKKFEEVAANEKNPNWEKLTERESAIYRKTNDIRSQFTRDYTRVLHSLAYRRLKHKTQVFFNAAGNDHICTRIEHVMHVESVSNTIAKYLGLNEELTRAIAMSHDLGHAPFGHEGERILSGLCSTYLNGKKFWHEQNGVYFVDNIELLEDNHKVFRNLNLTYAVRDGIISHCGELDQNAIKPRSELFDLTNFTKPGEYQAATWEGCVVKLADKIAYLGRDIEDATRLGYIEEEQKKILEEMAKRNHQEPVNTTVIMHNMIIDLCYNSNVEDGLCLSAEMSQLLNEIKKFNYQYIYGNSRLEPFKRYSKLVIEEIFENLLAFYQGEDTILSLDKGENHKKQFVCDFKKWLAQYIETDLSRFSWASDMKEKCCNKKIYGTLEKKEQYIQAIIDFISGMTDIYAIKSFNELLQC